MLNRLGYGVVATLVLALVALNVVVLSRALADEDPPPPRNAMTGATQRAPAPASTRPPAARTDRQAIARKRRAAPPPGRSSGATIVLTATRGDCWVEARDGSPTGKALYMGTLATGSSLRFKRPKLWVRLGAASNVDLVVNGQPSSVPPGTVELVVPDA